MRIEQHVPQYPAHLHKKTHDLACRTGDSLVGLFAIVGFCLWGGYEWGWGQHDDQARSQTAEVPAIVTCPTSNPDQDVLEHTWSHQGTVIHRECLVVNIPVYAPPRYSVAGKGP
jgi:hypothetical protein